MQMNIGFSFVSKSHWRDSSYQNCSNIMKYWHNTIPTSMLNTEISNLGYDNILVSYFLFILYNMKSINQWGRGGGEVLLSKHLYFIHITDSVGCS